MFTFGKYFFSFTHTYLTLTDRLKTKTTHKKRGSKNDIAKKQKRFMIDVTKLSSSIRSTFLFHIFLHFSRMIMLRKHYIYKTCYLNYYIKHFKFETKHFFNI